MAVTYVFRMTRGSFGYEPGDEVTEEFAAARPWAVQKVKSKDIATVDKPKKTGGDK